MVFGGMPLVTARLLKSMIAESVAGAGMSGRMFEMPKTVCLACTWVCRPVIVAVRFRFHSKRSAPVFHWGPVTTLQALQVYRQHFMQLEVLRDRLISQGNPVIEELMELYPTADRQQLRNLQRQAARELELKKPPTASKKIFAYLRQLSE